MNFFKTASRISAVLALTFIAVAPVAAWTGPSTAPPGGNTAAPINSSGMTQTKAGYLGVNGGYTGGYYPFSVSNTGASSWTAIFNWPYNTATGHGILVGSSASGYSQFENGSGYYSLLAYSSYGLYTNGNVYASDIYDAASGIWMSTLASNNPRNGGMYWYGAYTYIPNPATGGYGCPSGFSAYGAYTVDFSDGHWGYAYICR